MDLSNLQPAEGSRQNDNFRRGRGHGSGMVKQQVKATKDRKHVPEHRDRDLKVVRCLYTDVFRREVSKQKLQGNRWNQCRCSESL